MHDTVLFHKVERDENLNGESTDKSLGDPLEVVHLNEFIQVHWQNLKGQDQMLSEYQGLDDTNDVLLVFWVVVFQLL